MMDKETFLAEVTNTFATCQELIKRKNADYSGNDADPFKNFKMSVQVGVSPERAILVRISDKLSRISNLLDKEAQVKDESIEDTINDAINYLVILKALRKDASTNNL